MKYARAKSMLLITSISLLSLASASAQPSTPDVAKKLLGASSSANACFQRRYDPAHLATHPKQNVTSMLLLISTRPEAEQAESHSANIGVKFRKRGPQFRVEGYCSKSAGGLDCAVACDGGAIDVVMTDGNSVLVKIPTGARVWEPGHDTEDGPGGKTFGADDKTFRLDRVSLSECLSLAPDAKTRAALRRGR
jgi:hypothetical protein